MDAREVLQKAAEIISEDGHHKGQLYAPGDKGGPSKAPVCAMGAINRAVCGNALITYGAASEDFVQTLEARINAIELLQEHIGDFQSIAEWNDDKDTSAEEVILTMKNAAH